MLSTTLASKPLRRLGKREARHDHRALPLLKYAGSLPTPAKSASWLAKVEDLGMMFNDNEGDCTIAAVGHMIQAWTANATKQIIIPDSAVQAAYVAVTGEEGAAYDPSTGDNDNGCYPPDVLEYWRTKGVGGHKLDAWASIEPRSTTQLKQGVQFFGGVYLGVQLPLVAQRQINAGQPWTTTGSHRGIYAPGSWGGHAVPVVAYDPTWLYVITWGAVQQVSWQWYTEYVDEAYVAVSNDWLNSQGISPSMLDAAQLQADLASLGRVNGPTVRTAEKLGLSLQQILALVAQYGPQAIQIIQQILAQVGKQAA